MVNMFKKQNKEVVESKEEAVFDNSGVPVKYGGLHGKTLMYTIVFVATTGFSLFGYDQGLMSGIIASRQFNREFPQTKSDGPSDVHGGTIQGTVTAIYEVGCFFGAMFAYFFGERLGRRHMMLGGAYVMIIGTIIQVTAFGHSKGFLQFMIGRTVTGLGNGANTSTIPSWVAETSKAHNRGFLICMEASTVAVGTAIAYWLDYGCAQVDNSFSWRFPTAFQIFFACILVVGVWFLPESPRWLLAHGYEHEGTKVVAALAGTAVNDPATMVEKQRISDAILNMQGVKAARKRDILINGKKQNLRRALVGASTQVFQQLGGCNAVIYYSTILFERQIGLDTQLSLILGGVLSIVYALSALTSFFLVERVGRRRLFLIGTVGQAVAMFIVFGCLLPGDLGNENSAMIARGAAFGLFLFIIFFGSTWLPLPWLYPAEINSLAVRTQANAISTMSNWLMNFLVVQVLPTMTASISSYTFLLFAIANCLFLPVIYLYYPETTGRTLEELDVLFAHAHLTKRRPTIIAKEMPMLTEHQVDVMTERYDINDNNGDPEAFGAPANAGHPDTTLPPTHPSDIAGDRTDPVQHSGNSTRVPTPENLQTGEKTNKL